MRKCPGCGKMCNDNDFHFARRKRGRSDGKASRCKECCNKAARKYYHGHYKECTKRHKEWIRNNRFQQALKNSYYAAVKHGHKPCNAAEEEISVAFNGICKICGVPESECKHKFRMDHDHETGEFRGWICDNCNKGLGHFKDNPEIVLSAAMYLEKFRTAYK